MCSPRDRPSAVRGRSFPDDLRRTPRPIGRPQPTPARPGAEVGWAGPEQRAGSPALRRRHGIRLSGKSLVICQNTCIGTWSDTRLRGPCSCPPFPQDPRTKREQIRRLPPSREAHPSRPRAGRPAFAPGCGRGDGRPDGFRADWSRRGAGAGSVASAAPSPTESAAGASGPDAGPEPGAVAGPSGAAEPSPSEPSPSQPSAPEPTDTPGAAEPGGTDPAGPADAPAEASAAGSTGETPAKPNDPAASDKPAAQAPPAPFKRSFTQEIALDGPAFRGLEPKLRLFYDSGAACGPAA
jgi:hypothetical protein